MGSAVKVLVAIHYSVLVARNGYIRNQLWNELTVSDEQIESGREFRIAGAAARKE